MRVLEIEAVDYHTAGEPFRIVTGQELRGRTILEKRRDASERLDHLRRLLVNEPRGHADMYGCFVTEPEDDGADLGVVFFHNAGYSTACGHGTIALVTWALDRGLIAGPRVVVDVPSGRLETEARVRDGRVRSVRFRNVPSFVLRRDAIPGIDIAFGGAFYASVEERVSPAELPRLIERGRELKRELEANGEIVHPLEPELRDVYGVIFWQREGDNVQRNVTVFADGEVDRSPCGSGTSARLALLDASRELPRGEELRHLSIVGTEFRGRVVGDAEVAGLPAVITEVEGSAHRTGEHRFVLEDADDLGTGFLLR
ncbi:MAG: proline racemase family protein [Gaiellaceae bacterium]